VSESTASSPGAEGAVHLHIDGPVASMLFDRPAARNAMTWTMYSDLAAACDTISANPEVRVAVLRGMGGKAFVAGTDIAQFQEFDSGADGVAYEQRLAAYVARVDALAVPTIAVVEGMAVGGGMAIATVCDFRIATPGARFGVPIARTLGNCLSAGTLKVMVEALGVGLVKRMLLLAELVPAEELLACGFVLKTVAAETLDAEVDELCQRLAGHAPITMSVTKQLLSRIVAGGDEPDLPLLEHCYASDDFHEGVDSFVNRRPPRWTGR